MIILRYIYSGTLSLNEYETSDIIKILIAANELSLQELINFLQSFLIENKSEWMELNFNDIYQAIFENNSFSELQDYLWEHVVKWGHTQNPELPSDPTNFSKEDFNTLKNSLQRCIPFINFYNLTSEEFSDNVLPYKKILPKELYKDLLKSYLKPNNRPIKNTEPNIIKDVENVNVINTKNIDSKIITSQHAELILKWINVKSSNDSYDSSISFTSLFSKFIYNDIKDKDTSSTDNNNIENHILSRVNNEKFATFNSFLSGLNFGNSDLTLYNGRGNCIKYSYEKSIRKTTGLFSVEEYEVFQII
ncbi:BTB/POZ protein [Rhizophagus irregularis DAOM 181602=DAOM 197198]|nr:BTB/POZ protein [Rhizophagus irregularis DAOM 181602=DAOM 197198]